MKRIVSSAILTAIVLSSSQAAFAHHCKKHHHCKHHAKKHHIYKEEAPMPVALTPVNTFEPNWYVGGNIGVSRTHDKKVVGSNDSVTQIGPGWTADVGYQFFQFYRATLAAELGFTQYHKSNETRPGINVASTEHFTTYLAAVAQYPLVWNFNILGKLGLAYSYANKIFTAGAAGSANTYSPYYGAGISYNMTPKAALLLQWDRARGNGRTGSTDLASLGVTYNFL